MSVCDESKHTRREKHTRTRHTEPRRAAPLASRARLICPFHRELVATSPQKTREVDTSSSLL